MASNVAKLAIILAAGMGTRLRPFTLDKPKCLIEVLGRPIIDYQLEALEHTSVNRIVVVAGYKSSVLRKYLATRRNLKEVEVIENKDYLDTNNMYSLYIALEKYLGKYDYYFILNGDVVFEAKIARLMDRVEKSAIAVDRSIYLQESMKVTVDRNGKIASISKDIPEDKAYAVSIDFYVFDKSDASTLYRFMREEFVDKGILDKWTEFAIDKALRDNAIDAKPVDITGLIWWEIDDVLDLKRAEYRLKLLKEVPRLKTIRIWMFDLDGTLLLGEKEIVGSSSLITFLRENKRVIIFITNNSSIPNRSHAERLRKILGIPVSESEIYSSLDHIGEILKEKYPGMAIYALLPRKSARYLQEKFSLKIVDELSGSRGIVLVGFDTELTYEKLKKACIYIQKGALFIVTHPDTRCPTDQGFIPDAGSIAKLIELVVHKKPEIVGGKPNPDMIQKVLRKLGASPQEACFIGDRIETDMYMAIRSGIMPILFLTGEENFQSLLRSKFSDRIVLGENPLFLRHFLEQHAVFKD